MLVQGDAHEGSWTKLGTRASAAPETRKPGQHMLNQPRGSFGAQEVSEYCFGRREKTPTPKTRDQHLNFTKDPRPLYYKTPSRAFYHKIVRSKAVFGP